MMHDPLQWPEKTRGLLALPCSAQQGAFCLMESGQSTRKVGVKRGEFRMFLYNLNWIVCAIDRRADLATVETGSVQSVVQPAPVVEPGPVAVVEPSAIVVA